MDTFILCLDIIGGFFAALILAIGVDLWLRRRANARRVNLLAQTGLGVTSLGPETCTLQGMCNGVALVVEHGVKRPLPGLELGERSPQGTWLALRSQGPDVVICRKPYTELIVGALATPPRHLTGSPRFDASFDTLSQDPAFDARSFPPPHCLDALFALGLHWLHRKSGQLEVMFGEVAENQLVSTVAIGVALGAQTAGPPHHYRDASATGVRPPVQVVPGERPRPRVSLSSGLLATLFAATIAFFVGFALITNSDVRERFSDVACEPGFHLELIPSSGPRGRQGKSTACARGQELRSADDTVLLACGALASSAVISVGSLVWALVLVGTLVKRRSL